MQSGRLPEGGETSQAGLPSRRASAEMSLPYKDLEREWLQVRTQASRDRESRRTWTMSS